MGDVRFNVETYQDRFAMETIVRLEIEKQFSFKELYAEPFDPRRVLVHWAISVLEAAGADSRSIRQLILGLLKGAEPEPAPVRKQGSISLAMAAMAQFMGLCAAEAARAPLPPAVAKYAP